MAMDWEYIGTKLVAPGVGCLLANVMYFSGVSAMMRCKRAGRLGDMNPLPFPVMLATNISWIMYSILLGDYFLFFSDAPGAMVSVYFTQVGYSLTQDKSKTRAAMETSLMSLIMALLTLTLYVGIVARDASPEHKQIVVGIFANLVLVMYYAAPLSEVKEVIRTRDSRSLYFPLAVAQTICGGSWLVYGIALNDPFIYAPNGMGTILGGDNPMEVSLWDNWGRKGGS
mmetsp:Transcript_19062/g.30840  ORF Transcript_19062/g.30840 Transcript_19062/m.30840 type:complete len:227 (+) Transcript_19062:524-1204(+)